MSEAKNIPSLPDIQKGEARRIIIETAKVAKEYINRHGIQISDGFQSIHPQELETLGLAILDAPSLTAAYDLMAATPSDGSISFYDRLIAEPQHLETYKLLDKTIRNNEPKQVKRAIDIATGTGFCAMLLSQRADHVVAIDTSEGLLSVTERQLKRLQKLGRYMKTFETKQMNALSLDYPDNYFDIATSNALTHYLTYEEQEAFYREVHRVLKPGGRYYEPQQDGSSSDSFYMDSPRGMLAKAVAAAVLLARDPVKFSSGTKSGIPNPEEFGFDLTTFVYQTNPFTRQVIRCIKK